MAANYSDYVKEQYAVKKQAWDMFINQRYDENTLPVMLYYVTNEKLTKMLNDGRIDKIKDICRKIAAGIKNKNMNGESLLGKAAACGKTKAMRNVLSLSVDILRPGYDQVYVTQNFDDAAKYAKAESLLGRASDVASVYPVFVQNYGQDFFDDVITEEEQAQMAEFDDALSDTETVIYKYVGPLDNIILKNDGTEAKIGEAVKNQLLELKKDIELLDDKSENLLTEKEEIAKRDKKEPLSSLDEVFLSGGGLKFDEVFKEVDPEAEKKEREKIIYRFGSDFYDFYKKYITEKFGFDDKFWDKFDLLGCQLV